LTTGSVALNWNLDTETLEINDRGKNDNGGEDVGNVGKSISPEGFFQGAALIIPSEKQVEQCNDSALEFGTSSRVHSGWTERFPDNGLAYIGRNE
jgi:hypothetical protein